MSLLKKVRKFLTEDLSIPEEHLAVKQLDSVERDLKKNTENLCRLVSVCSDYRYAYLRWVAHETEETKKEWEQRHQELLDGIGPCIRESYLDLEGKDTSLLKSIKKASK